MGLNVGSFFYCLSSDKILSEQRAPLITEKEHTGGIIVTRAHNPNPVGKNSFILPVREKFNRYSQ